jgi:hypothetical protein
MSDIKINCKGVIKLLKNQNIHKATGPDSIPSFILKSAADQLAPIPYTFYLLVLLHIELLAGVVYIYQHLFSSWFF